MTLTLNISDDLRPEEAAELVEIARTEQKSIGSVLLAAARDLVRKRQAQRAAMTPHHGEVAA